MGRKVQGEVKGMLCNRSEAATIFGVSPATIDAWVRSGAPYVSSAKVGLKGWEFDSAALIDWVQEREIVKRTKNVTAIDENEPKHRKMKADAAIAEINLKRLLGELVNFDEFLGLVMDLVAEAMAGLLVIPNQLCAKILTCQTPEQARQMMDSAIRGALKKLSGIKDEFQGKTG
jgi:phage terminase Nu1 subunit (DNA packaging protein)